MQIEKFHRLFVCFGDSRRLVLETEILLFIAVDGAHMRRVFGGAVLAAVIPTANRQLWCIAHAMVESESEESCTWFARLVLQQFPGREFVWMTDQGVALTGKGMTDVLAGNRQCQSTCAQHLMATLQANKQRSAGEIEGSLQGLQFLLFQFARARTKEVAEDKLREIKAKNSTVEKYLRKRVHQIAAYAILDVNQDGEVQGHCRGGRIAGQLAESWNKVAMPLRRAGVFGGIVWLCEHAANVRAQNLKAAESWASDDSRGQQIKCLAPNASREFIARELVKNTRYEVYTFRVRTSVELEGVVINTVDEDHKRTIAIRRSHIGAMVVILCGCLTHQEYGYPCARAVKFAQTANLMEGTNGLWNWREKEFFAPFFWFDTWLAQLRFALPPLVAPVGLEALQAISVKSVVEKVASTPPGWPRASANSEDCRPANTYCALHAPRHGRSP